MQMQMKFATYKLNAFLFLFLEIEKLMHKMPVSTFNHSYFHEPIILKYKIQDYEIK